MIQQQSKFHLVQMSPLVLLLSLHGAQRLLSWCSLDPHPRPQAATRAHTGPHPDSGLHPHPSQPCFFLLAAFLTPVPLKEQCRSMRHGHRDNSGSPKRPLTYPVASLLWGILETVGPSSHDRERELEEALESFPSLFSVQRRNRGRRKMVCPQLATTLPNHCALFLSHFDAESRETQN